MITVLQTMMLTTLTGGILMGDQPQLFSNVIIKDGKREITLQSSLRELMVLA
jgi:hypothetical protein